MKLSNVNILDEYNHNDKGFAHLQYEPIRFVSPTNSDIGYIKLFDFLLQYDVTHITNKTKKAFQSFNFNSYVYTPKASHVNNVMGFLSIIAISYGGNLQTNITFTPLIKCSSFTKIIEPYLIWNKTSETDTDEYLVEVYMKVNSASSPFTIQPLMLDKVWAEDNVYNDLYNNYTNLREKCLKLFSAFPTNTFKTQAEFDTLCTGYNIVTQSYVQDRPASTIYYSGSSMTIENYVDILKLNPSSAQSLTTIVMNNVYEGKKLQLMSWNANTTLVFTAGNYFNSNSSFDNQMVLKGGANLTLATGNIINFVYMNNKWIETSRNF